MTKNDLIANVAGELGITKKFTKEIFDGIQTVVFNALKEGEDVKVFDGVVLSTRDASARTARNPRTGETIDIPARKVPKCKFGKTIKDIIA